jgi:hypothetical protein
MRGQLFPGAYADPAIRSLDPLGLRKYFALSGLDCWGCHFTQGVALGYQILPLQGDKK